MAAGRQDTLPNEERLRRGLLARYDWEAQTRVLEDGGRIAGSVMVISRPSPDGVIATLHAAGEPDVLARDLQKRWHKERVVSTCLGVPVQAVTQIVKAWDHEEGAFRALATEWLELNRAAVPTGSVAGA